MKKQRITIVGAGLTGPLLSIFLARRGHQVDLFESRPDPRKSNYYSGRSINLALSERGVHALKELDLFKSIEPFLIPMRGRMIHTIDEKLLFQPYSVNENEFLYSVSRGMLNQHLLTEIEHYSMIETSFGYQCTSYDVKQKAVHFFHPASNEEVTLYSDITIAADGSHSAVRRSLSATDRFNFSQDYLSYGYKELSIPSINGKHQMETNALHIWPRKNFMLIALPNTDGSFTCTLFLSFEGEESFAAIQTEAQAKTFFETYFPDTLLLIPNLAADFFENPTGSLVTVKCSPWNIKGDVLLIGDAAHAITPFFGQGMNASFEDCVILNEILETEGDDFEKAFTKFSMMRKKDADAIANMANENFVEMRDLVSDPAFQKKKKNRTRIRKKISGKIPISICERQFFETSIFAGV